MSERKRMFLNWLGIAFFAIVLLANCDSFDSQEIQLVKSGTLATHPEKTIGKAAVSFLGDPKWETGKAEDGTEFVNVSGRITYADKPVTALLQFQIDKTNRTFEATALEFNGVPQSRILLVALLEKMYE